MAEVVRVVGCLRATVYRTVYRYEELGEGSIRDQRRCRPPSKVTQLVEDQLLEYLDHVPQDYGWERSNWTLALRARQLAHEGLDIHFARIGTVGPMATDVFYVTDTMTGKPLIDEFRMDAIRNRLERTCRDIQETRR